MAVIVFLIGLYISYRTWKRGFPQYRPPMTPTAKDLTFTTKHLVRKDIVSTWLLLWPLHVTFLVIFFGHLRSIGLWSVDWFLRLAPRGLEVTPCGRTCTDCHRYQNNWCHGCPDSRDYKNPLIKWAEQEIVGFFVTQQPAELPPERARY